MEIVNVSIPVTRVQIIAKQYDNDIVNTITVVLPGRYSKKCKRLHAAIAKLYPTYDFCIIGEPVLSKDTYCVTDDFKFERK